MYDEALEAMDAVAGSKAELARRRPLATVLHAAMAGVYVGFGILLIFLLGAPFSAAGSPGTPLVMGATFGIALSLVVFAGSDLFTGNTLVMTSAALRRKIAWPAALRAMGLSYLGNLAGAMALAWLALRAGSFDKEPAHAFVVAVAAKKIGLGFWPLFFRGILCNWLVTLAVWSTFRMKTEAGKLTMIFWCLLGFIGSGYEHSVANMTLLTLANLLPHGPEVSWLGMAKNLVPVTLGNFLSGAVCMAGAYGYVTGRATRPAATVTAIETAGPSTRPKAA